VLGLTRSLTRDNQPDDKEMWAPVKTPTWAARCSPVRVGRPSNELSGRSLEGNPAAVVTSARSQLDDQSACAMTAWWCSMTMTDLPPSTSRSSSASRYSTSARVEPCGRLVENADAALVGHVVGQLEPLPLATREGGERLVEAEVAESDVAEPFEHLVRSSVLAVAGPKELRGFSDGHCGSSCGQPDDHSLVLETV
jgi:hypothetical protein